MVGNRCILEPHLTNINNENNQIIGQEGQEEEEEEEKEEGGESSRVCREWEPPRGMERTSLESPIAIHELELVFMRQTWTVTGSRFL